MNKNIAISISTLTFYVLFLSIFYLQTAHASTSVKASSSDKEPKKIANADIPKEKVIEEECKPITLKQKITSAAQVYADTPFKEGEKAVYEVYYGAIYGGDGELVVQAPYQYQNVWAYMFDAYGKTGDWFKMFYVAEDRIRSISRAGDFGALWFFLDQDEGKLFGKRRIKEKYLTFDPIKCSVSEQEVTNKKDTSLKSHYYYPGSIDAFSVAYKLRTHTYKKGEKIKEPVFTSDKNWWLEAEAVAEETIKVPAGSFLSDKIKLQTYVGDALQQKGDVHIWIAKNHPNRPIVKINAVVRFGTINANLKSFSPGK